MTIHAHAALERGAPLTPFTYEAGDLGPFDVEVKISHCGICHSDLHLIDNDWRNSKYPLVPGHEIIGVVSALGPYADASLMGKRVGVGWIRGSCLSCEWCLDGQESMCRNVLATCVDGYGGFGQAIRVDSRFVQVIPDALRSENAAPLLCAGITVYAPMRRYNVNSSKRVGVIGIGGLGHLAIQYAHRFGCEVVAFTSTPAKTDEAKQLGAYKVVNSRDSDAMKAMRYSLDFIISTVTADLNWKDYIRTLRPNGTLCFVGAPDQPLSLHVGYLMDAQRNITASSTGGRGMMREMLEFSARHNITAWTETLPMDSANAAIERLRRNDVRYRFVLEA